MNVSREDIEKKKVNKIDSNSVYHGKRKALEDQEINLQIILERQDRLATIIEEYTQLDMQIREQMDKSVHHLNEHISSLTMAVEIAIRGKSVVKKTTYSDPSSYLVKYESILQEMNKVHHSLHELRNKQQHTIEPDLEMNSNNNRSSERNTHSIDTLLELILLDYQMMKDPIVVDVVV